MKELKNFKEIFKEYNPLAGTDIETVVKDAIKICRKENVAVLTNFNGLEMCFDTKSEKFEAVTYYHRWCKGFEGTNNIVGPVYKGNFTLDTAIKDGILANLICLYSLQEEDIDHINSILDKYIPNK